MKRTTDVAHTRWPWLVGAACGVASLYVGLQVPVNDDDVYHLHSIWLVAHGFLPYREFFEVHPPGLWLLLSPLALLVKEPSQYFLAARAGIALLFGLTIALGGRLGRARGLQALALVAVGLGVLSRGQVWVFRVEYVAAFLLIAHLSILAEPEHRVRPLMPAFLAAILMGLGCTMSVRLLPFLVVEPIAIALRRPTGLPPHFRTAQLRAWSAGLLIGALPAILYLTLHGLWADLWFWAVRFVSSTDVVSWDIRLSRDDMVLIGIGSAAALLSLTAGTRPPRSRTVLALAWVAALAFHILNPHKVAFSALYAYLTTGLLLAATPSAGRRLAPNSLHRFATLATFALGVVFFGGLIRLPSALFDRGTQARQLEVLDWLRDVAGPAGVVLVAPYHPMTVGDATDLQNAWQYTFWIGNPAVQQRLERFGETLLRHPPPVIAANPWPLHTDGMDLVTWLAHWNVLQAQQADAIRAELARRYSKVVFPGLDSAAEPPHGNEFWVRKERLAKNPPPSPFEVR